MGKIVRFVFFFLFIYFIVRAADGLAGYNTNQAIFFFLTFNFVDVLAQFLFREVYRFRGQIVSGDFDLVLSKPVNPLLRVLLGGSDLIDLITIPPLIAGIVYVGRLFDPSAMQIILYILLLINGLLIAAAFHIAVISLGVVTLEVDNVINLYRDLTNLGRFPIDIYQEPLKSVLTYLVPVGIMISLPAKALIGLVSTQGVVLSLFVGAIMLVISLAFWKRALKSYTSASS